MSGRISNVTIAQEYYAGKRKEEELSPEQELYLKQIKAAFGMHLEVKSMKYIVGCLMKDFGLSQASAYRINRESKLVFADMVQINKAIERNLAVEMAKENYRIAKLRHSLKEMNRATMALIKAAGLDREDPDIPDFEKIQPSIIIASLPEDMEDAILSTLKQGAIDLNQLPKTIDITHEEVR